MQRSQEVKRERSRERVSNLEPPHDGKHLEVGPPRILGPSRDRLPLGGLCGQTLQQRGGQQGVRKMRGEGDELFRQLGDLLVRAAREMAQHRRETDNSVLSRVRRQVHLAPLVEPISSDRVAEKK